MGNICARIFRSLVLLSPRQTFAGDEVGFYSPTIPGFRVGEAGSGGAGRHGVRGRRGCQARARHDPPPPQQQQQPEEEKQQRKGEEWALAALCGWMQLGEKNAMLGRRVHRLLREGVRDPDGRAWLARSPRRLDLQVGFRDLDLRL